MHCTIVWPKWWLLKSETKMLKYQHCEHLRGTKQQKKKWGRWKWPRKCCTSQKRKAKGNGLSVSQWHISAFLHFLLEFPSNIEHNPKNPSIFIKTALCIFLPKCKTINVIWVEIISANKVHTHYTVLYKYRKRVPPAQCSFRLGKWNLTLCFCSF